MNSADPCQGQDIPTLLVDNLSKSFRGKTALENVSFSVSAASLTVILGPAGAGKTTTLRLIAGLEYPDKGCVLLSGRDAGNLEPKYRDIAMIFDNLALYPNKSGFDNIASPLVIQGESKEEIEKKVDEIATTLKISHVLNRLPKTMSGGERQRIALGRALIRTPKLFLLDESLSSLDAKLRIELRAELKRLQRELGYTFLLTTPDFQEALAIANTVIMLWEGRIVQIAHPQELYDTPVDRKVARFIGAPQINLVDARCVSDGAGSHIAVAGAMIPLPDHFRHLTVSKQTVFELGIRPENLKLSSLSSSALQATLTDIEPLGLKSVLTVQKGDVELRLLVDSSKTEHVNLDQSVGIDVINSSKLLAFDKESGLKSD